MIGVGAALVQNFAWVLYLFGAFLLFTGVKMALEDSHPDLANNPILVRAPAPAVTDEIHGSHFFVRQTPRGRTRPCAMQRRCSWHWC